MIVIFLSVLAIGQISALTYNQFLETYDKICFQEDKKWKPNSAVSMENFIDMVEKIETTIIPTMSTENLVRGLLSDFSCNRLSFDGTRWKRERSAGAIYSGIISKFLENGKHAELNASMTEFSKEEKCQIFFMLSEATQTIKFFDGLNEVDKFLEHGVVSLNEDKERAIDISKVLYGILAGFNRMEKTFELSSGNYKLDNLYAFTIAETFTLAIIESEKKDNGGYDTTGYWTSTICPKQYEHGNENALSEPSLAEIVGAVDGFLLGNRIRSIQDKSSIKLSQILRMYYSPEGFKGNLKDPSSETYCKRSNFISILDQNKAESDTNIKSYIKIYGEIYDEVIQDEDAAINDIRSSIGPTLRQTRAEMSACASPVEKSDICETPADVSFILDKRSNNFTEQEIKVGNLINKLNVGLNEGNVSIYVNSIDGGNLRPAVNPTNSKAYASCRIEAYDETPQTSDDFEVLNGIKRIFAVYEEDNRDFSMTPAKVVVIFNFENEEMRKEKKKQLDKAARELRNDHPNAMMIPVGVNTDYLKTYFTTTRQQTVMPWDNHNLVPDLKLKICEIPAVFHHQNCKTKSEIKNIVYRGYIGVHKVQHFAMYPESFLKSFNYEFQFKAENGIIRVCYSRNGIVTNSDAKGCHGKSDDSNIVIIKKSNPCKDRNVYNCEPIYLSVFGRADADSENCRTESDEKSIGCKRLDLIQYTVSHKGLTCSSAKQLISTPIFQILMTFFIIFYIQNWRK